MTAPLPPMRPLPGPPTGPTVVELLNASELRELRLLSDGDTHAAIARKVGSCPRSVRMRLSRAYRILGARNGVHAVAIAIRAGLLPVPDRKGSQ